MSRNFELLQRLAQRLSPPDTLLVREPVLVENEIDRPDLALASDPAVSQLLQRLPFTRGDSLVPAAVTFCGTDDESGRNDICARAACILSGQVKGLVCVVDANFRAPSLGQYFGIPESPGLAEAIEQPGAITAFARKVRGRELTIITAGQCAPEQTHAPAFHALAARVRELRESFDYVLIQAPPLTDFACASFVARLTDGIVLILEAHSTRRDLAARLKFELQQAEVPLFGAVLNNRRFPIPQSLYSKLF